MADEIRSFTVTTPVGVSAAMPLITSLAMPARTVQEVEIRVPPGPNGELGFSIGMVGQPVIPANVGEWIVTSDEVITWVFGATLDSGSWQCLSYNTGQYPHTIQVRFLVNLLADASTGTGGPALTDDQINAAGVLVAVGTNPVPGDTMTDTEGS